MIAEQCIPSVKVRQADDALKITSTTYATKLDEESWPVASRHNHNHNFQQDASKFQDPTNQIGQGQGISTPVKQKSLLPSKFKNSPIL